MSIRLGCPFDCGWTVDEVPPGWDDDLLPEDPRERLRWHLRVEHGAAVQRDEEAWQDGVWEITLMGYAGSDAIPPLDLSDEQDQ